VHAERGKSHFSAEPCDHSLLQPVFFLTALFRPGAPEPAARLHSVSQLDARFVAALAALRG